MADNIDSQEPKTLDEQISTALANVDDKGKIQFEENVDPLFKRAVISEKKARDNQASFTKSRQEIAQLTATTEVLETQLTASSSTLTAEQTTELDGLKHTDPDAWFTLKTKYETDAQLNAQGQLKELTDDASAKALSDLTLVERQEALGAFQTRTGIELTDDVMQNDIPPRLQNKINDMPFEDYLEEVATYLKKGKVVKPTDNGLDATDIGNLNGAAPTAPKSKSAYTIL